MRVVCYIVCGLPGVGKTTRAKALERDRGAVRFCPDAWIKTIWPEDRAETEGNALRDGIERVQWATAKRCLELGTSVVIEWGTWGADERAKLRDEARALGATVELHYLAAPREVLKRRLLARNEVDDPHEFRTPVDGIESFLDDCTGSMQVPTLEERGTYDAVVWEDLSRTIEVLDYDSEWAERFAALRARLWPAVEDVATSVEHVGSTSVPGLAAKPVVDISVVVPDMSRMPVLIERLAALGYRHNGDQGVPGREAFKRPAESPPHHLYACPADAIPLRNHLAIRDDMRRHPESARAYGDLKKSLAERFRHDIDGYVAGKTGFLVGILEKEGFTPEEIDDIRGRNVVGGSQPPKRQTGGSQITGPKAQEE